MEVLLFCARHVSPPPPPPFFSPILPHPARHEPSSSSSSCFCRKRPELEVMQVKEVHQEVGRSQLSVVDFDMHLEDVSLNWLNPHITLS